MPSPPTKSFTIRKSAGVINVRTDIQLTAPGNVADLLDSQGRLPANLDAVRLADVQLSVSTGDKAVTFGSGARSVEFSAAGGPFGGLGVYRDTTKMLADLAVIATGDALTPIPLAQIPFPEVAAARFLALYAGYTASASANGSVALAPGAAVTFGAQAGRRRAFIVVRAHADEPKIGDAVRSLVESWRLPSQVSGPDDLPPGTWIMAEVSGSVQANAGVQFGLDFNWIRGIQAKGLQGDIGLKIQAGASAAFGFNLSDRYAVVVGRDSLDEGEQKVRLRLHRLNERGWSFAAGARLALTGSTGALTPAQMDDFIAAILGVHGLQTLEEVRRWTDPSQRLSEVAAGFLNEFAQKRFNGALEQKFEQVRGAALAWFEKWDALPSQASSALWDISRLDEKQVKGFVSKIQKLAAGDEETVKAEIAELVGQADFFATPLGLWLDKLASGRVLGVLANLPQAKAVSEAAAKTLDILNGGLFADLKTFVEEQVGLAPVRRAIEANDFKTLNPKLTAKLAEFLGKAKLDAKGIQTVRQTIATLDSRAQELYGAAVKALNDTYRFTFDYAYQRSVTKTALLDVTFDFAAPKAKPAELSGLLAAAIAGDFRGVLPPPGKKAAAGVSFREASLTHHLQRSSSVKITLPFFDSESSSQTSSLASFRLASEDGGVYLYALDANDDVRRKDKWRSTMSVGMSLQVGAESAIRRHDRDSPQATVDYRFVRRLPGLRTAQFERLLDVLRPAYFPHALAGPEAPEKPSVHEWALALDKTVDGVEAERDDGMIGDSLLRLDVSLPGETLTRWLQAPEDKKDLLYMSLSRRIQTLLKRFIPFIYFQDPAKYKTLQSAYPLLVYAALPVTTSIEFEGGRVLGINTNRDAYWEWIDDSGSGQRRAMILDSRTFIQLSVAMADASKILESAGGRDLRKLTRSYAPSEIESARKSVLGGAGQRLLESLLGNETSVIDGAVKAGVKLAEFRRKAADPEKAIEALAEFGDQITRTFNRKLQTIFKPSEAADREVLRNLGLLVFAEASEILPPGTEIRPAARLDLLVFKSGQMPQSLTGETEPPAESISLRQALVEAG